MLASDPAVQDVGVDAGTGSVWVVRLIEPWRVLDEVRAEGEIQGLRRAVLAVLAGRGFAVDGDLRTALAGSEDPEVLESVLRQAATATTSAEILAVLRG